MDCGAYRGPQGLPGIGGTVGIGTVTTGAAGSSVVVTNVGTPNAAILDITIPAGPAGPGPLTPVSPWVTGTAYVVGPPASYVSINGSSFECLVPHTAGVFATDLAAGKWGTVASVGAASTVPGPTGPAFLKPIAVWAASTAYVTGPPASYVSNGGSSYECLVAHTSGSSFATDLAAGKWGSVSSKGQDGAGTGTVQPTGTIADSHVALFSGTTGDVIKDGGALAAVALSGGYGDLSGKPTLGSAAALNAGASVGNAIQVQTGGKYPALDGSLITNLPTDPTASARITAVERGVTSLNLRAAAAAGTTVANPNGFTDDYGDQTGIDTVNSTGQAFAVGDVNNLSGVTGTVTPESYSPPASFAYGMTYVGATPGGTQAPLLFADFSTNTFSYNGTTYSTWAALVAAAGITTTGTAPTIDANGIHTVSGSGFLFSFTMGTSVEYILFMNAKVQSDTTQFGGVSQATSSLTRYFQYTTGLGINIGNANTAGLENYSPAGDTNVALAAGSAASVRSAGGAVDGAVCGQQSVTFSATAANLTIGYAMVSGAASGSTGSGYIRSFALYPVPNGWAGEVKTDMISATTNPYTSSHVPGSVNADTGGSEGWTFSASEENASSNPAVYAFAGALPNSNTHRGAGGTYYWITQSAADPPPQWIQAQAPTAWNCTRYRLFSIDGLPNVAPTAWTLAGANSTSGPWTTLDTRSGITWSDNIQSKDFSFTNTASFTIYRLTITATVGGIQVGLGAFDLYASNTAFVVAPAVMSLRSVRATLKFTPSRVFQYAAIKPAAGAVVNTDFSGAVTRDGSTYTAGTFVKIEDLQTGYSIYELQGSDGKPGVDVTGQPSGVTVGAKLLTTAAFRIDTSGLDLGGA